MDVYSVSGYVVFAMQSGPGGVIGGQDTAGTPAGGSELADGSGSGPGGAGNGAAPANPFGSMWPILLAFVVFMVLTTMMSGRREKREKKNLMSSLGKHDRVQLSGGMIGTITEVKPDEVVVRVDESTKTTIRFVKTAVVRVIKSGGVGGADAEPDPESQAETIESATI